MESMLVENSSRIRENLKKVINMSYLMNEMRKCG